MAELLNKGQQICSGYELVVYTFVKPRNVWVEVILELVALEYAIRRVICWLISPVILCLWPPMVYFCLLHDFHTVEMFRLFLHQYN